MESSISSAISLHEKLTNSTTFLVIISAILFTENFLHLYFGVNLFSVSFEWYKANVQLKDIILYVFWFSISYGLIFPTLLLLVDIAINAKSKIREHDGKDYTPLRTLKYDSIIENNTVSFGIYEKKMSEISQTNYLRKLMIGIVALSATSAFRGLIFTNGSEDLFSITIESISQNNFTSVILKILILLLSAWFLIQLSSPPDKHFDSIYIKNYSKRKISNWISEVESGLLNKEELLLNLEPLNNINCLPYREIEFNYENKSHTYCKKHGLLKLEDNRIKLTEKGEFFTKYIS
jgi:hypothetical protein